MDRAEVEEMKRTILRLCRERARPLSPLGAGQVALDELLAAGLIYLAPGNVYALTEKGQAA
jgi:hypothetical protein